MTLYHNFTDDELNFYLKFENPLEIVANDWNERRSDLEDMSYIMNEIYDKQDALDIYPLINDLTDTPSLNEAAEQVTPPKKPSLTDKLQAAGEKVKEQDSQGNGAKSKKHDERG
jgi:hypothetical protein